jgi:hypothetical protein
LPCGVGNSETGDKIEKALTDANRKSALWTDCRAVGGSLDHDFGATFYVDPQQRKVSAAPRQIENLSEIFLRKMPVFPGDWKIAWSHLLI